MDKLNNKEIYYLFEKFLEKLHPQFTEMEETINSKNKIKKENDEDYEEENKDEENDEEDDDDDDDEDDDDDDDEDDEDDDDDEEDDDEEDEKNKQNDEDDDDEDDDDEEDDDEEDDDEDYEDNEENDMDNIEDFNILCTLCNKLIQDKKFLITPCGHIVHLNCIVENSKSKLNEKLDKILEETLNELEPLDSVNIEKIIEENNEEIKVIEKCEKCAFLFG